MTDYLKSNIELGEVTHNIGAMFRRNWREHGDKPGFAERRDGAYGYFTWQELTIDLCRFSSFLLDKGLKAGDRVAVIARNSYDRLIAEMAVMSCR